MTHVFQSWRPRGRSLRPRGRSGRRMKRCPTWCSSGRRRCYRTGRVGEWCGMLAVCVVMCDGASVKGISSAFPPPIPSPPLPSPSLSPPLLPCHLFPSHCCRHKKKEVKNTWELGLPPSVRGQVWSRAIGNALNLSRSMCLWTQPASTSAHVTLFTCPLCPFLCRDVRGEFGKV